MPLIEGTPNRRNILSGAPEVEDFESLLKSFEQNQATLKTGDVVRGTVLSVTDNYILVDIEYKSEGRIPLDQLRNADVMQDLARGSVIEAVVESIEDEEGYIILSYEKVGRQKLYDELERNFLSGRSQTGVVVELVKGGLTVDIGVRAFLPGSQIDLHPVKDLHSLLGQRLEVKIIQFNKLRRNVVVSRRAVLESYMEKIRLEIVQRLVPGNIVEGVVKNVTDYGVFMNLGGVDGLLHKTDISWGRVRHPADFFQVGDKTRVMVLHFDHEGLKVSLGYKQLEADPWKDADIKYPAGTMVDGRVTSSTEYGVFVEIEKGIEGLVHQSELSWKPEFKYTIHAFRPGSPVKVMVLEIDVQARRLSLSVRRTQPNPWQDFIGQHSAGNVLVGTIRGVNPNGLAVEVGPGVIGRVHKADISWRRAPHESAPHYRLGAQVRVVILEINADKHLLSLGIKQLEEEAWDGYCARHQVGETVEGIVTRVMDFGVFVQLDEGVEGLCHMPEAGAEPADISVSSFQAQQAVRMTILRMNMTERKIALSFRQAEAQAGVESNPPHSEKRGIPVYLGSQITI